MPDTRIGLANLVAPVGYTPAVRAPGPPSDEVVIIPIHGTLVHRTSDLEAESGLASHTGIAAQLNVILTNPEVAVVLLDIDSPGGESGGVFDLADRIRAVSQMKPVRAMANDMAFSAAYMLASAVTHVSVACTSGVGLIDVIVMHVGQSVRDVEDDVRYIAVFAGERKNDLNPYEPLSDAAHAALRAEVDHIYELFVETVARYRSLDADAMYAIEAGLFFGLDAAAISLVDAVGGLDDAFTQLTQSLSPLPAQVTPASRAGFLRNYWTESSMNDRTDPVTPDRPLIDPVGSPLQLLVVSTATVLSVANTIKIAQTYTLAGRTDPVAGSLDAQSSPTKVRSQLLAVQAEASPEIINRITPDATHPVASDPLANAARQIAAQSTKKET